MRVHFGAATPTFAKNIETYRKIYKIVKEQGHEFAREFSETTSIEMGMRVFDDADWEITCDRIMLAIKECDVAIYDATDKATFGVGYEAATTLAMGKPVLLLLREGSLPGAIISGLKHPLLARRWFNEENLSEIVKQFLRGNLEERDVKVII